MSLSVFQAYSCDGITGTQLDRVKVSGFKWQRLMSARGSGEVTFPLDGTYTIPQLRVLTEYWSRLWALEYNGDIQYMGYVVNRKYDRDAGTVTLKLMDLWGRLARRGGWDHGVPNVAKWKVEDTVPLAQHAVNAIIRGRDTGPLLPAMGLPVTLPGQDGDPVLHSFYGYNQQTVDQMLQELLDEGLDIFFEPRWIRSGDTDWLFHGGPTWTSSYPIRDLYVTAPKSEILSFTEDGDGARITNNARRIGSGSEEDMLVRSNRNPLSPYPLLDRVTSSKSVEDPEVLSRQATADLSTYGQPTIQWSFKMHILEAPQVGDRVRLHFYDDPWITDGPHERRVVQVAGDMSEIVTVYVQPTGGA